VDSEFIYSTLLPGRTLLSGYSLIPPSIGFPTSALQRPELVYLVFSFDFCFWEDTCLVAETVSMSGKTEQPYKLKLSALPRIPHVHSLSLNQACRPLASLRTYLSTLAQGYNHIRLNPISHSALTSLYPQWATPIPSCCGGGGRGIRQAATSRQACSTTMTCCEEMIDKRIELQHVRQTCAVTA
jgi:hypothetical protein